MGFVCSKRGLIQIPTVRGHASNFLGAELILVILVLFADIVLPGDYM